MKDYLVSIDRDDNPVMFVVATTEPATADDVADLISQLKALIPPTRFGMIVDPEEIGIFDAACDDPQSRLVTLSTQAVLGHYSPSFTGDDPNRGTRNAYLMYLRTLVGAWLRDLALRRNPTTPPGMSELAKIGLLDRLENGFTNEEVSVCGHALH